MVHQSDSMQCRRVRSMLQLFLLATLVFTVVYLLNSSQPSIHTLVSETHRQLNSLKHINLKESLHYAEERLKVDSKYLTALGFTSSPRVFPNHTWTNVTLPVIVTAAASGQGEQVTGLVLSARRHQSQLPVVVFDLGLGRYERQQLEASCNSSMCWLQQLEYASYPAHLDELRTRAFVPVVIQEVLNKAGAVLWLDLQLDEQLAAVPTTAFTHYKMFDYFDANIEHFYFHKMVSDEALLIYNTPAVHRQLMLPWLRCALLPECVAPTGAQAGGCRFNKKPHYRYSGCHGYDTSALNVALGLMFRPDRTPYIETERLERAEEPDGGLGGDNSTAAAL
ncbi:uncharacterized protein LOC122363738 isoform X2 [Amphibalanus amphitrite]|uniref:uncharacterized protein LOC122363738 isoform X2 n=1 Tax=Amphibalanus amphitrite TaxID=1232801 RepID=UPI001C8FEDF0|nr:uncharacterized protein LOC122363738 isoform X2 [Amphibalanus amphitrite]